MILKGKHGLDHSMAVRVAGESEDLRRRRKTLSGLQLRRENILRAAFQEMAQALITLEQREEKKAESGAPDHISIDLEFPGKECRNGDQHGSTPPAVPLPPEGDPARLKWEIDAALDAALPEKKSTAPSLHFSQEEIATVLDSAFPEELMNLGIMDLFGEEGGGIDTFAISYEHELKCLRILNRRSVNSQWLPVSILKILPERN